MTNKEVMQMALDTVQDARDYLDIVNTQAAEAKSRRLTKTLEALRAALAQGEQSPVAWGVIKRGAGVWFVNDSRFTAQYYANNYAHRDADGPDQRVVPLYTIPPQRTWIDPSSAEIKALWNATKKPSEFAALLLAKFKEKNS